MTTNNIESALLGLGDKLPVPVDRWHVEKGPDATDDPAVWVWATLKDEDASNDTARAQIRSLVRETLKALDEATWVYVRFRAASETP